MKLLIEEYQYEVNDVFDVLDGLFTLQDVKGKISVSYVGYYYNPKINDVVFVLPKVLIDEDGLVFGQYDPTKLIHLEDAKLEQHESKFLYEFAVWIHRAIVVYNDTHADNGIILRENVQGEGHGSKKKANTWLDVILSLIRFNKENRSFFTFVLKNIHSGYNKINWTRTISGTAAVVESESPVYINPVNKKRQINFDEELIIIFFSILHYISSKFGFSTEIPFGFPLIKGVKFKRYIDGYGRIRLKQIKYKYFSDVTMRLWNLCYAFFERSHQIHTTTSNREYLLAKSFHIVFEAMIEELIGDRDVPKGLKEQPDGKLVDHFYTYEGLLINREQENDIYYIGDSKYYKIGSNPGENSVFKQYTYARNVIQWNLNLFLNPKGNPEDYAKYKDIKLRDEVTEGYNVIPNFFISANIDPKTLTYNPKLERHKGRPNVCRQFENRLYDRDTLIVSHYDVNFLHVLALYARANSGDKALWKSEVRDRFRTEIQEMLKTRFEFYAMTARPGVDGKEWIKSNFQQVLGKTYSPFLDKDIFSLALDKDDKYTEENEQLLESLREQFFVEICELGEEPTSVIEKRTTATGHHSFPTDGQYLTCLVRKQEIGEDEKQELTELYKLFSLHEATGKTYVMLNMPSGSISEAKYLLPMVENAVDGYYDIEEFKFGTKTKVFTEKGVSMPVKVPTLKIKIGAYHPFDKIYTEGVVPRMANQVWDENKLRNLFAKTDALLAEGYMAATSVEEPEIEYGLPESSESDYLEN